MSRLSLPKPPDPLKAAREVAQQVSGAIKETSSKVAGEAAKALAPLGELAVKAAEDGVANLSLGNKGDILGDGVSRYLSELAPGFAQLASQTRLVSRLGAPHTPLRPRDMLASSGRLGEQGRALWDAALQTRTHIRHGGFAPLTTVRHTPSIAAAREGVLEAVSWVRVGSQSIREQLGFDLARKVAGDPFLSRALAAKSQGLAVLAKARQELLQSFAVLLKGPQERLQSTQPNLPSLFHAMGKDVLPRFAEMFPSRPPLSQLLDARVTHAMQPSPRGTSPEVDLGKMVKIFKELPSSRTLKELLIPDNEEAAANYRALGMTLTVSATVFKNGGNPLEGYPPLHWTTEPIAFSMLCAARLCFAVADVHQRESMDPLKQYAREPFTYGDRPPTEEELVAQDVYSAASGLAEHVMGRLDSMMSVVSRLAAQSGYGR